MYDFFISEQRARRTMQVSTGGLIGTRMVHLPNSVLLCAEMLGVKDQAYTLQKNHYFFSTQYTAAYKLTHLVVENSHLHFH